MKKIGSYLNKNKAYIISFLLGFIFLFIIMNQVVMYADDYILEIQSKQSFIDNIKYLINHYFSWGGGHTPLLVIIIYQFGFWAWKILNTLVITIMLFLGSKMISKNKKQFLCYYSISWILFYMIGLCITRESIYWLDGSMAYVISTFEVFMLIYMIYTRFIQNKSKKYDSFLLPIVGFMAGWSGAQTAAITLIITILFAIWYILIKHNKMNKRFILLTSFSLLGSAIFLLSPGNGNRMESFEVFSNLGLIDRVLYRISSACKMTFDFKEYPLMSVPFFIHLFSYLLLFLSFIDIKKCKNKKGKIILSIAIIVEVLFLMLTLISNFMNLEELTNLSLSYQNLYELKSSGTLYPIHFLPYLILFSFLLSNLIVIINHTIITKNPFLLGLFLSIYCAQFSMILAPYTPYRTCLTAILFIIIAIIYIIKQLKEADIEFIDIVPLMLVYINTLLALIVYIILNIIYRKAELKNIALILCIIPFTAIALINYRDLYKNYKLNKQIYNKNVEILKNYDGRSNVIFLNKEHNINYQFESIIGITWIEDDIRSYFNIPNNVELKYIEEVVE